MKRVFPPIRDLPYIDTENVDDNQLTLGNKIAKEIKTLLNTLTSKGSR